MGATRLKTSPLCGNDGPTPQCMRICYWYVQELCRSVDQNLDTGLNAKSWRTGPTNASSPGRPANALLKFEPGEPRHTN